MQPRLERADCTPVSRARVRHRHLRSCLLLIGLGLADRELEPARSVELELLDVQGDELRAAHGGREPEQQERPVAQSGEPGRGDRLDHTLQRVELGRRGPAQRLGAVLAADPRHDRGHGPGVARVRLILGAVRGGDRRGPAADRDRPEPAVGLRDQNAATLAGSAGIACTPRAEHQVANTRQSRSYAHRVAGASEASA